MKRFGHDLGAAATGCRSTSSRPGRPSAPTTTSTPRRSGSSCSRARRRCARLTAPRQLKPWDVCVLPDGPRRRPRRAQRDRQRRAGGDVLGPQVAGGDGLSGLRQGRHPHRRAQPRRRRHVPPLVDKVDYYTDEPGPLNSTGRSAQSTRGCLSARYHRRAPAPGFSACGRTRPRPRPSRTRRRPGRPGDLRVELPRRPRCSCPARDRPRPRP